MKGLLTSTALVIGLMVSAGVYAEAAPAGATGLCKDGSYYTGANKQGACRGHKGIKDWYATTSTTSVTTAETVATTAKPAKVTKASKTIATTSVTTSSAAPAGSTGLCNDGSYYTGANKQGACRGHKGVKDWYGPAVAVGAAAAMTASTPAASAPAAAPAPAKKGMFSFLNKKPAATPTATAAPTTTTTTTSTNSATTTRAATPVAAGGGAGQVWVNTGSNVYHCQGSQWYGKTKTGQYMTEAAAKAAGARPDHGKACM